MSTGSPATGGFGALLHGLRRSAGLTQEELAHAAGVSVRALSYMERGRSRGPQRRTVQALAAALRLDAAGARQLEDAASLGRSRPVTGLADEPGTDPESAPATGPTAHHTLALPRDLSDFTARGPALDRLRALAEELDPARPPVAVVCGQPGLGKTAFAVHAAHTLAPHFPDGQFALDLRGMDAQPVAPRDALGRLLHASGIPEGAVPAGTEDRAGLLRSVLRDRRVLLLLDNAATEDQVRPLLPGHGPALTLVTSRHALSGLEAVHSVELALLRREEAVELLTRIVGPERVRREEQAARDLAELCGHLPLAVRIAAQRLASRPEEHIAKLVTELAAHEGRLDALRAGSLEVRAAFALSYRQLDEDTRTVFRRAALASGPDAGPETLALLAGLPPHRATRAARDLTDAGLLQPHPTTDRYRFHDLLRLFATEQLAEEDRPADLTAAHTRTDTWMLRRAAAAARLFSTDPGGDHDGPDSGGSEHGPGRTGRADDPDPASAPSEHAPAHAWLEAERAQWLTALHRAHAAGRHRQVLDTAEAMHWFSDRTSHWEEWTEVFGLGVGAARALGSGRDEAVHLNYLAWAHSTCRHDHTTALATAQAALAVARAAADRLQTGWAFYYAAIALIGLDRAEEATTHLHRAAGSLAGQTDTHSRLAELSTLNTLGRHLRRTGHADQALAVHRRSEALCGGDFPARSDEARGITLSRLHRTEEARATLSAAHQALVRLNHPRQLEAATHLLLLDEVGGAGGDGGVGGVDVQGTAAEHTPRQ